ncbi:gamma carbonic anhydrase family protein [Micromonospora sp. NPDC050417]|uniref:gamma carbonic anhydrase family protein n=1 Tax=Micromonospora sp. NPDC050417 TaxID=3364280 RepID=UPI0037874B53
MRLEAWIPVIDPDAFVAPTAVVVGNVNVGANASVWYHAVLRSESSPIVIGPESNIQDNCTVHADPEYPVYVGTGVSVGHGAVIHGCVIGDGALVGMGATVLNGADIGARSLVAAHALVPQGLKVPSESLVTGVPARVRRKLTREELGLIEATATAYMERTRSYRNAVAL